MATQIFPEPTVGALIFNDDNKIFLMKSHKWGHKYTIPGGHIEVGETMKEALIREVKEETNLAVYDIQYVAFYEVIFDPNFLRRSHFIFFDFKCKTHDSDVVLNDEAQEYIWADVDTVMDLNLEDNTRRFIQNVIGGKSS